MRLSAGLGGTFATLADLNDAGVAVGYASNAIGRLHAITFDGVETVDLNLRTDLGSRFELQQARRINDRGVILAQAFVSGTPYGGDHAVLLVPTGAPPPVTLSLVGDVVVNEDEGVAVVTALLSGPADVDVTGTWSTAGGTATTGTDFEALASVPFSIPAGEVEATVEVTILQDDEVEPDQVFTVSLQSVVGATVGVASSVQVTIEDDDVVPSVVVIGANRTVTEGTGTGALVNVPVTLDRPALGDVEVGYVVAAGTAAVPADVAAGTGSIVVADGASSGTIALQVVGDAMDEANEGFSVTLTGVTGVAQLGARVTAQVTINDDDPTPTISVGDVTVAEGGAATLTVTLNRASGRAVSVAYAARAGTATAADFTATSGRVTIAAGATSATVSVTTTQDTINEPVEQLTVTLTGPTNATLADGSALVRINDDDPTPTVSVGSVSATEGQSGAKTFSFVVRLSNANSTSVSATLATVAGSAVSTGSTADFTAVTRTLTFAPGATTATFGVVVRGDRRVEPDETFTVRVNSATGGLGGVGASGTGTIRNDD